MVRYIGKYEVIRELGAGHFGTVYAAVGEVPGRGLSAGKKRLVAIKKLNEGSGDQSRELLRQEFALLDQVKHRGIVRVYEFMNSENAVSIEYIHGVTLRKMLDECSRAREQVFTEAAIEIVCEMADALYQAYTTPGDNGEPLHLVHRDLKPENIMLTPQGEVKILDFGLARVGNAEFAQDDADRIRGTPIYMAPEQARGQDVDHRSDLFSLGLIAYELFMNRPAYVLPKSSRDPLGDIFDTIERGALLQECRELESKLPGVGPILTRLLQANPRNRYQTGQDLLVDLRRQLYRDRGAYLQEFCEFFFGSIYELPEAPDISDRGRASAPGPAAPAAAGKRMSIEDRLKASMNRDQAGARGAAPPSTPPSRPAAPPRAEPPAAKAPRAEAWEPMAARPAKKAGESEPAKPKFVGARRPDETGMLQMVSLADKLEENAETDSSATAFFAIPAPKADGRARAAPAPVGTPNLAGPPPMVGGPLAGPPMMGGPIASGPMVSGPIASGPMMGTPISGPIAQGPVAAYNAGASQTPFGVTGVAPPPADADQRTQSNRVYAIVLAMFFLVGVAIFAAIWLAPKDKDGVADGDDGAKPSVVTPQAPEPQSTKDKHKGDTAVPAPIPDNPTPKPKPRPSGGGSTDGGSTKPPPTPKFSGPAPLNVSMSGDLAGTTSLEVNCPSGFRERGRLNGTSATVPNVPQEGCTLFFKGGPPAKFSPVRGGQSLSCSIQGTTGVCK